MNDIRGGRVTGYMDDIQPLAEFGEGQVGVPHGGRCSWQFLLVKGLG